MQRSRLLCMSADMLWNANFSDLIFKQEFWASDKLFLVIKALAVFLSVFPSGARYNGAKVSLKLLSISSVPALG